MSGKRSKRNGLAGVDRVRLQAGFNLKEYMEKGEGEFSVDENAMPPVREEDERQAAKDAQNNFFQNCSLKNILVEAVTDDAERIVLSDYITLGKRMRAIVEDGGIKKKVDRPGNGQKPPPNAKVWIYYTVMCEIYDEPIDATYASKRMYAFKLGNSDVLPVLDLGVATMELNEISKFLAEPAYAYGPLGLPDRVPANCPVLFTVELCEFMEATALNAVFKMNAEERALIDFEEIYKAANEMKVTGNKYCLSEDWTGAISKYRKGIHILDRYLTVADDVDRKRNDLLFILYINLAQCYLHTKDYEKVISMCRRALDLPPKTEGNRCKAYYRQAKAEYELGHFDSSKDSCKEALIREPSNPDARTLFEQVNHRLAEDEKEERNLMKRMFSGLTIP